MALKLIHTADWHLGQTFFGYDREADAKHCHVVDLDNGQWLTVIPKARHSNRLQELPNVLFTHNSSGEGENGAETPEEKP